MKAPFSFLLGFSLLAACTKDIRVNIPPDEAMPVMTTIVTNDSTIAVDLSYSKPILEPASDYSSIKDAMVSLFVDDAFVEELTGQETGQSYHYASTYRPAQGENIRIEAKVKDQVLKGETTIPSKPVISSGSAIQTPPDAFGNKEYKITFSINDKPNTTDYYQLRIYQLNNGTIDRQNPLSFIIENIKTQEGGIFDDFISQDQSSAHYFDDYSFNGQNFVVMVKSKVQTEFDKIAIELSAISRESYLYFKSIQLQDLRNDDPLYEKVSIYSNIINGLGIVGAANRSVLIQQFEK